MPQQRVVSDRAGGETRGISTVETERKAGRGLPCIAHLAQLGLSLVELLPQLGVGDSAGPQGKAAVQRRKAVF